MFFRSRFGEDFLSPRKLVATAVLLAAILLAAEQLRIVTGPNHPYGPWVRSALSLFPAVLGVCILWHGRTLLVLVLVVVVTPLWLMLWLRAPELFRASELASRGSIATILGFGVASILVAAFRIAQSARFPAVHHASSGHSEGPWMRWLSRSRSVAQAEWETQIVIEPALVAGAALILWGGLHNGLGVLLAFVAFALFDSACRRYRQARLSVALVTSGFDSAQKFSTAVREAMAPNVSAQPPEAAVFTAHSRKGM